MSPSNRTPRHGSGFTLVELIVAIVVIGTSVGGILLTMNRVTSHSADPMVEHQAVAIAEAYLEEISLLPFTDPDLVPAVEAARVDKDDVADYDGFTEVGPRTLSAPATVLPGLGNYTIAVSVQNNGNLGPGGLKVPAGSAVLISVRVTNTAAGVDFTLSGYRTDF